MFAIWPVETIAPAFVYGVYAVETTNIKEDLNKQL